jgi:hypothetical protein
MHRPASPFLTLFRQDHHEIFDPVLEKVKMVLLKQLEMAYEKGESVQVSYEESLSNVLD